jgi:LmbE family N-acetylglucosaminyl deacetylase
MTEPTPGDAPALEPLSDDDFESVLCVVAHPDDIEYGTAAAVAKWTAQGKRVSYFLLTRGEAGIDTMPPNDAGPVREAEERASAAVVGVTEVDFGDHRDGQVEYGLALRRDIAREVRRRRPDLVITGDYGNRFVGGMLNQADHRAVGLAAADAVADAGNRWIFPELLEEGLEPWNVGMLAFAGTMTPTHYVDVADHVDVAVASLEEHAAYNAALPDTFPKPDQLVPMILDMGAKRAQVDGVTHAVVLDVVNRR